jgi:hypothetical protein
MVDTHLRECGVYPFLDSAAVLMKAVHITARLASQVGWDFSGRIVARNCRLNPGG